MQISDKAIQRFWKKVALPNSNGCMLWMKGRFASGYGKFSLNNKTIYAHRFSLILSEGLPESDDLEAAHSCRNSHCVAPNHLEWKTHRGNMLDKKRDGTNFVPRQPVKLTSEQRDSVYEMYSNGATQQQIASIFGVAQSYVSRVISGYFDI